ncbi:MAG: hypothetical protein GTO14_21040 [Anaerolineales bacterium]|nr:hypothetical protein [Anaerolineales bacterium]
MFRWNGLDITWLFMAVIFIYFAILAWVYSRSPIRPFVYRGKRQADDGNILEAQIDQIPEEIQKDLEGFVKSVNTAMQTRYRIGAISMLIAAGMAIASMFIG